MHDLKSPHTIDSWLNEVRSHFIDHAPHLISLFETYAAEAKFGRAYIDNDLKKLHLPAKLMEVGAGSLLLSCQLVREGFDVVAVEPIGNGFSHFDEMRQIILDKAKFLGCSPLVLNQNAETISMPNTFDYAFSINVMEHVDNAPLVLKQIGESLITGATYRFICPNYSFPYEPHFNIPTLLTKRLTEKVLRKRIFENHRVIDPAGTWKSLNWIDVCKVNKYIRSMPGFTVSFSRTVLSSALERTVTDNEFASRRSRLVRYMINILVQARLHYLFNYLPAMMQPLMDCKVEKKNGA